MHSGRLANGIERPPSDMSRFLYYRESSVSRSQLILQNVADVPCGMQQVHELNAAIDGPVEDEMVPKALDLPSPQTL